VSEIWESIWYPDQAENWLRRAALTPLAAAALLFRAGVGCRNAAYARGWLKTEHIAGIPVISVGNLNAGGTGKTPAVIYLANLCAARGRRVAVLSRGYARESRGPLLVTASTSSAQISGDEPLLIARRCPGAVVLVGADRLELAQRAREEHGRDLILLDDGMQYRRLRRDLEIVVIDESVGLGNGKLLPRGPLREAPAALSRADLLWIRTDTNEHSFRADGVLSIRVRYAARVAISPDGGEQPASVISHRRAFAFAGIARPRSFLRTLGELSANLVGARFFPDHHSFTRAELDHLLSAAKTVDAEMLLTTEKDRIRLPSDFPAWTIRIDVEILEGGEMLSQKLDVL
jgi:tetraacyldisaccharide 4'-kinase